MFDCFEVLDVVLKVRSQLLNHSVEARKMSSFCKPIAAVACLVFSCGGQLRAQSNAPDAGKPEVSVREVKVLQDDSENEARQQEVAEVRQAVDILNTVLKSESFRKALYGMHAHSQQGRPGSGVYDLMIKRSPLQLRLVLFDGNKEQNEVYRTEGYEDDNFPDTCFVNRYFWVDQYKKNPGFPASLMLHESMHVLGFVHHAWWFKRSTVPYTMNYIYDDVAKELGLPTADADSISLEEKN